MPGQPIAESAGDSVLDEGDGAKRRRARGIILGIVNDEFRRDCCLHPHAGSSCGRVIDAHTVSRSATLASVADSTAHVLTFFPRGGIPSSGALEPRSVGLNVASTFRGFCDVHDAAFFPLDTEPLIPTVEQCSLLAFRGAALDYYKKSAHIRLVERARAVLKEEPELLPYVDLQLFHEQSEAARIGLEDMEKLRGIAGRVITDGNYDALQHVVLRFSGNPVIAATGMFHPDFDLDGRILQMLSDGERACELMTVSVIPRSAATDVVFTWVRGDPAPPAFIDSLLARPESRLARLIPQVALAVIENVFFSPQWWGGLSERQRARLTDLVQFMFERKMPLTAHHFVDWQFESVIRSADMA